MVFERSGVHAAGTLPDAFRGCERQEGDPQFRLLDALYHSSGKCNTVNGNETLKRAIRALPGFSEAPGSASRRSIGPGGASDSRASLPAIAGGAGGGRRRTLAPRLRTAFSTRPAPQSEGGNSSGSHGTGENAPFYEQHGRGLSRQEMRICVAGILCPGLPAANRHDAASLAQTTSAAAGKRSTAAARKCTAGFRRFASPALACSAIGSAGALFVLCVGGATG